MMTLRPTTSRTTLGEQANGLRIQAMLLGEDASRQRILRVVRLHRHARLQDYRPGVHRPVVDEVHGRSGNLRPVLQRLALRVETREGRQERRMDVHGASGEGPHVRHREDPHVAGVAHQADTAGREFADQRQIERFAVAEVLGLTKSASTPAARARSRAAAAPDPR